jgi:hypothetical protein
MFSNCKYILINRFFFIKSFASDVRILFVQFSTFVTRLPLILDNQHSFRSYQRFPHTGSKTQLHEFRLINQYKDKNMVYSRTQSKTAVHETYQLIINVTALAVCI